MVLQKLGMEALPMIAPSTRYRTRGGSVATGYAQWRHHGLGPFEGPWAGHIIGTYILGTKTDPMKQALPFICMLVLAAGTQAQVSIRNGDFEEYTLCPDGHGQLDRATDWFTAIITPDYLNCTYLVAGNNESPTQSYSGAGWAGFLCSDTEPRAAEALGQHLEEPLFPGHEYRLTLAAKIPSAGNYTNDCGGIGIYGFEDTLIMSSSYTHASTLPGAMLIGLSGPVQHSDWQMKEIVIVPTDTVNHILLTIESIPWCKQYIYVDGLVLSEGIHTGIGDASGGTGVSLSTQGDGHLLVQSTRAVRRLMVTDALGRSVHEAGNVGTSYSMPLRSGAFWVTCFSADGRVTKAVVVP